MTLICGGALLIGLLSAFVLPFLPFAASLSTAVLLGTGIAIVRGQPVADTLQVAFAMLLACQVGYGLGLIAVALSRGLARSNRPKRPLGDCPAAEDFRPGRD